MSRRGFLLGAIAAPVAASLTAPVAAKAAPVYASGGYFKIVGITQTVLVGEAAGFRCVISGLNTTGYRVGDDVILHGFGAPARDSFAGPLPAEGGSDPAVSAPHGRFLPKTPGAGSRRLRLFGRE